MNPAIARDQVGGVADAPNTVEEGMVVHPMTASEFQQQHGKGNRRLLWLSVGGFALLGVALFAVLFPVLHNDSDSTNGSSSSTLTQGSNSPGNGNSNSKQQASAFQFKGPFYGNISYFSPEVTKGYDNADALKGDLASAAKFTMTSAYNRNIGAPGFASTATSTGSNEGIKSPSASGSDAGFAAGSGDAESASSGVNSYGTNNQEKGIEEGDIVVSDGTLVYAAYGDQIVIWNADTGTWITNVSMPPVVYNDTSSSSSSSEKVSAGILPVDFWRPKAYINSLVLHENRLMAIVGGYGASFTPPSGRASPILYNYLSTNVRLYDTSALASGGSLELIGDADINGYFSELREINGTAYIVTTTGIDTYTDLVAPFDRWQFQNWTDDEYTAYVKAHADDAISSFVDELVAEISVGGAVPDLAKISLFQTGGGNDSQVDAQLLFGDGLINNLVEVFSFDMKSAAPSSTLEYSASGLFTPSYWSQVYAVDGMMIIAGQGWNWIETTGVYDQSTYLIAMELLPDGTTSPSSVGKLPGYIQNDYSIDVVGTTLRITTTVQSFRPVIFYDTPILVDPIVVDGTNSTEGSSSSSGSSVPASTKPPVPISSYPTPAPPTSLNYVVMIDLEGTNGTMTELGRVQVGGQYDYFQAVRFFDTVGYAMMSGGPFYVVDLSDSANPTVLAELNNTAGWSSNLFAAADDASMLLSIADVTGSDGWSVEGLEITLFDVHVPTTPVAVQKYVIKLDPNSTYASTDSFWDVKSTRFDQGRLILPVNLYNWVNTTLGFAGFMVFDVNKTGIKETCSVPFSNEPNTTANSCYCGGGYLPSRSMIFNGELMTMNGHLVASTDLDACEQNWWLEVDVTDTTSCCGVGGGPIFY